MSATTTLRPGVPQDAAVLAEFNQRMALETEGIALIPQVILSGVTRLLDDPGLGYYLLAEHDGDVIAALMVTTEWSDWRNGVFWWIQSVYVVPEWRRQGLYRRLYQRVKQMAQEAKNVCGFRLYVERHNHAAQQTYQRCGMLETHYKLYEELCLEQPYHENPPQ